MPPIDARLWLAWACFVGAATLVALGWFAVMEALAIKSQASGDTLTEVVRALHIPLVLWFMAGGLLVGIAGGFALWWPLHLKLGW